MTAVALAMVGCGSEDKAAFNPSELVRPIKTYKVTSVKKMDVRTYPGRVGAGKKVNVSFIIPGSLIELEVKEGEFVQKGARIARLDPASYKHNLNTIKAQLEEATSAFKRAKKLWVANAISKADYDRAKSAYEVLSSQKNLSSKSLKDTYLYAPFSGYIAKRYVDNYQTVGAGSPIVSIQDIKDIEIVVNIPETLIMNATGKLDYKAYAVFEIPEKREYEMQIKETGTEADPVTQTYPVKFVMPSPDDINVLPGMTVAAKIIISENYEAGAYEIPVTAVSSDSSGKKFVWTIGGDMKVKRTEVETDGLHGGNIVVLSGLNEGDEIAAAGTVHLIEGMTVKRLELEGNRK
jgi:RND family efflux transporter MFP subunit